MISALSTLTRAGLLALILVPAIMPGVRAQSQGTAALTLVAQTPWNSTSQPALDLKVRADGVQGDPLGDLSLALTIFQALPTRSDYRLSLTEDVGAPIETPEAQDIEGTLDPGSTRVLTFHADVSFLAHLGAEARVYPLKLELISGTQHVAELRTPLIFLPKKAKEPLSLAWTFVIGHPIAYAADGTFIGRDLERRLAPGGSLSGEIEALRTMVAGRDVEPVDAVVSPTLIQDLSQMEDGYRVQTAAGVETVAPDEGGAAAAATALAELRTLGQARKVELSSMPYGMPDLPQLLRSDLAQDLAPQLSRGRDSVSVELGVETEPSLLRPPGSSIDDPTLAMIHELGIRTLILDGGVVEQPEQPNGFAPTATTTLNAGPKATLTAIAPDDGLQELVTSSLPHDDPRLATQVILGDLASIWLEQPDQPRAMALIVSAEQDLPGSFFAPLVRTLSTAPWLRPMKATQVAEHYPAPPDPVRYRVGRPDAIPSRYVGAIDVDRTLIAEWISLLADGDVASSEASTLTGDLLITEGSYFVEHERLGLDRLRTIRDGIESEFAKVSADTQQVVTLTANGGRIPVRITNSTRHDLKVRVALVSSRVKFTSGDSREVSLTAGQTQVLVFDASAQTTGTFPVKVAIETPSGAQLTETTITVRSTAYSRIALLITLAAIGVLLVVWARRSLSKKDR